MSSRDRRDFLKKTAVAVTAIGLPTSCTPSGTRSEEARAVGSAQEATRTLDGSLLRSLAEVVLPSELGADGREAAVVAFETWLAGFAPAAERPHPYISPEITYGPPDPAPGWTAQLTALDLESRQRHGAGFAEIDVGRRERLVRAQADSGTALPDIARARHVSVGLMAHFFDSPLANDLCYRARIGKQTCRGLSDLAGSPAPPRLGASRPAFGTGPGSVG